MRIEKQIKQGMNKEQRQTDAAKKQKNKIFAAEVKELLRSSWSNSPTAGEASTEAERLAAVLLFMRTQLVEYMRIQGNFRGVKTGFIHRDRVAMDAWVMLSDIVRCRRHPIHDFFDGISGEMNERRPATHDVYLNSALIACVQALQETDDKLSLGSCVRAMQRHPGLGPYTPNEATMRARIHKSETGSVADEYAELIRHYRNQMVSQYPINRETIIARASDIASLIGHPLSMEAATTIMDYSLVSKGSEGICLIRPPSLVERPALQSSASNRDAGGDSEL